MSRVRLKKLMLSPWSKEMSRMRLKKLMLSPWSQHLRGPRP